MWTWGKTGEFSYPSLNHYYTNNKTNQIDFEIKKDLYDNIKLIGKDDDNLKKDLIEKKCRWNFSKSKMIPLMSLIKMFLLSLKFLSSYHKSPAGDYFISMSLMDGGDKFETEKLNWSLKSQESVLLSFLLHINSHLYMEYFLLS